MKHTSFHDSISTPLSMAIEVLLPAAFLIDSDLKLAVKQRKIIFVLLYKLVIKCL